MTRPSHSMCRLMGWIAKRLRFAVELTEGRFIDPLNEQDVFEQLQYGRD